MDVAMAHANGKPDALLSWMDGLADPTRLRLLRLLDRHELGVVDLCEVLQMPQSTVSRHLKVLSDQGWVLNRRRATTNLYSMPGDELPAPAKKLWGLARAETDAWATVQQDELRLQRRLAKHPGDTKAFFAGAAGEWDRLRSELYGERFSTAALLALLPGGATVADLGCGTGQLLADLAPNVKRVIGVDNSPAMLKAARKRLHDVKNAELHEGELEALPLADATCDAVLLVLVLTYIENPDAVLREMRRVLKPGGKAVIVDLLLHDREDFRRDMEQRWPGFEPRKLAAMLSDAGFGSSVCRPLPTEPKATGPALVIATGTKRELQ